jgi:hypothetical protein
MFSQDVVRTSKLLFIIYNLDSTGFLAASDPMPPHTEGSCPILQGLNNLVPHHAGEERRLEIYGENSGNWQPACYENLEPAKSCVSMHGWTAKSRW